MQLDEVAAAVVEHRTDPGGVLLRLALEGYACLNEPVVLRLHVRNAEDDGGEPGVVHRVHVVRPDGVVAGLQQESDGPSVGAWVLDNEQVVFGHRHESLKTQRLRVERVGGGGVLDVDAAHFESHGPTLRGDATAE